jgi:3-oxoacyl-[acyl-carrier-protein] synthase III
VSSLSIGILGTGAYLPKTKLTNKDFENIVETSDQWIIERTGIRERRIAAPEEDVATMGEAAARQALENAGIDWTEVRYIISASNTTNYMYPATAIRIQHGLGLDDKLAAFDLQAGCSGFNYALHVAENLIKGNGGYAVVVGTDTNTRMLDFTDRGTCVLFGDGAGAVVIGPTDRSRLLASFLASSYNGKLYLKNEFTALNSPFLPKPTLTNNYMYMDGPEIFKFAVRAVQESLRRILEQAGMTREDIDFLVIHQANYRILETGARFAKVPMDKVYVNVDRYGNTSAASIPIALHEALMEGKIKRNHKVILISFGAGVTWAAAVLEWLR